MVCNNTHVVLHSQTESFTYPCPCGDLFTISKVIVFAWA